MITGLMILIIANRDDAHTRYVVRRLDELSAPHFVLDTSQIPRHTRMSAWIGDGPARMRVGELDPSRVRTVWLRRVSRLRPDPAMSEEDGEFSVAESKSMLAGLAQLLEDRFWVNPLGTAFLSDRGHGKLVQLERARELGLEIPRTLATNEPEHAREFVRSCSEGAIYKPFLPPTRKVAEDEVTRYGTVFTTKMDAAALAKLDGVRYAPCTFQELVPKRYDLRVIVIGDRVFATEIHSQLDPRSSLDFRRNYALDRTPYAPHALPEEVASRCVALCRSFGLRFGAIDLVHTPDDRYVFLEVNQQGQFLWLEQKTGQPLLDNFCQLLVQGRTDYACDAPLHEPGLPELPQLERAEAPATD